MGKWLPYWQYKAQKYARDLESLSPYEREAFFRRNQDDGTQRSDRAMRENPTLQGRTRVANRPKQRTLPLRTTVEGADTRP
jgi:hypothetical protein